MRSSNVKRRNDISIKRFQIQKPNKTAVKDIFSRSNIRSSLDIQWRYFRSDKSLTLAFWSCPVSGRKSITRTVLVVIRFDSIPLGTNRWRSVTYACGACLLPSRAVRRPCRFNHLARLLIRFKLTTNRRTLLLTNSGDTAVRLY